MNHLNATLREISELVRRKYQYGGDIKLTPELQFIPTISTSDKLWNRKIIKSEFWVWEKRVDACVKRTMTLDEKVTIFYSLVWIQYSKIARAKVEANDKFMEASRKLDILIILKSIN